MSETPRTDAEAFARKAGTTHKQYQDGEYVRAGFARQLERELAAAQKDAERYRWLRDKHKRLSYTQDLQGKTVAARIREALDAFGVKQLDCIEIILPLYHVPPQGEPIWCNDADDPEGASPEHFDYAANMDAAIDAAIAQAKPEQEGK
jgi:hypothetical protein